MHGMKEPTQEKPHLFFFGEESRSFWFSLPGISHIFSDSPFHVAYVALGVAYDPHVFFTLMKRLHVRCKRSRVCKAPRHPNHIYLAFNVCQGSGDRQRPRLDITHCLRWISFRLAGLGSSFIYLATLLT